MTTRHSTRTARTALAALAMLGIPAPARAELDVRSIAAARAGAEPRRFARAPLGLADRDVFAALLELPGGQDPAAFGLPRVGSRFSVVNAPLAELDALAHAHPDWRVRWSPPLKPLLDRAGQWTRAPAFREETGLTGSGVIVGVIDTGVDLFHDDLRRADGSTRLAYYIDFGAPGLGVYPEEEARCVDAKLECAIYGSAELDALLATQDRDQAPTDPVGHGTHVASLAAGSGGSDGRYVGSAPGASLIVAKATDAAGEVGSDATILLAAELVYTLAERAGELEGKPRLPAVVNVSLGSDFGPHDGSTTLERGLADLVGPDYPGRAMVVSAGNSAGLYTGHSRYSTPLGIHTEVHVPGGDPVRVPVVTLPDGDASTLTASVFVWIASRPGDDLRVGVERNGAVFVPAQPRGTDRTFDDDPQVTVNLLNGSGGDGELGAAVVVLEGTWNVSDEFSIRLEGRGTASLWVQASGDLGPEVGLGARFPGATKESTVTLPATSPGLIAVGATVNRTGWTDRVGDAIDLDSFGGVTDDLLDGVAFFSSAGPTADTRMKPELLAPGAFVAGAMSFAADPARNKGGMFASSGLCRPVTDCTAVDATHAIAMGTSMSAPIVAGAVALLLEGDPELTQDHVRNLLQAGARRPDGIARLASQVGAGALDLLGTLDAQRLEQTPLGREPSEETSWLAPAQTFAHPDPAWLVPMLLLLRDADGAVADATTADDVDVDVSHGRLVERARREAPGLFHFAVAADGDAGGATLGVEVYARGERVASLALPIAVDVNAKQSGFAAHGGCAVEGADGSRGPSHGTWLTAGLLAITAARGRRSNRGVRTARSPGRTDTWGSARPCSCRR